MNRLLNEQNEQRTVSDLLVQLASSYFKNHLKNVQDTKSITSPLRFSHKILLGWRRAQLLKTSIADHDSIPLDSLQQQIAESLLHNGKKALYFISSIAMSRLSQTDPNEDSALKFHKILSRLRRLEAKQGQQPKGRSPLEIVVNVLVRLKGGSPQLGPQEENHWDTTNSNRGHGRNDYGIRDGISPAVMGPPHFDHSLLDGRQRLPDLQSSSWSQQIPTQTPNSQRRIPQRQHTDSDLDPSSSLHQPADRNGRIDDDSESSLSEEDNDPRRHSSRRRPTLQEDDIIIRSSSSDENQPIPYEEHNKQKYQKQFNLRHPDEYEEDLKNENLRRPHSIQFPMKQLTLRKKEDRRKPRFEDEASIERIQKIYEPPANTSPSLVLTPQEVSENVCKWR